MTIQPHEHLIGSTEEFREAFLAALPSLSWRKTTWKERPFPWLQRYRSYFDYGGGTRSTSLYLDIVIFIFPVVIVSRSWGEFVCQFRVDRAVLRSVRNKMKQERQDYLYRSAQSDREELRSATKALWRRTDRTRGGA